jgi:hypothetical protein
VAVTHTVAYFITELNKAIKCVQILVTVTNTLAYFDTDLSASVKSFIVHVFGLIFTLNILMGLPPPLRANQ